MDDILRADAYQAKSFAPLTRTKTSVASCTFLRRRKRFGYFTDTRLITVAADGWQPSFSMKLAAFGAFNTKRMRMRILLSIWEVVVSYHFANEAALTHLEFTFSDLSGFFTSERAPALRLHSTEPTYRPM